jgi:hypothetical protein
MIAHLQPWNFGGSNPLSASNYCLTFNNNQMEKYFVVFSINRHTTEGCRASANSDDEFAVNNGHQYLKGFNTKRAMLDWIEAMKEAIREYQMLKPID